MSVPSHISCLAVSLAAPQEAPESTSLNAAGLTIMVISISAILTLLVCCYRKVLKHYDANAPDSNSDTEPNAAPGTAPRV